MQLENHLFAAGVGDNVDICVDAKAKVRIYALLSICTRMNDLLTGLFANADLVSNGVHRVAL